MTVSHLPTPHVARVVIANPLQIRAIAHAGVLASLHAAGFLPEVWTLTQATERLRRLVARRNQVVQLGEDLTALDRTIGEATIDSAEGVGS